MNQQVNDTIAALKELMGVRSECGLPPVTNLESFFLTLSETGFDIGILRAMARMGMFCRCFKTGAYSFSA